MTRRSLVGRCTVLALASAALVACSTPPRLHPLVATQIQDWDQTSLAPPVYCGSLVKIEYDPTKIADASPVYFNNRTGAVVARCDNPMVRLPESERVTCPPLAWTCGR